jgi:phage terminase large subunit-like protein
MPLTAEQEVAAQKIANFLKPTYTKPSERPSIIEHAEKVFYIPETQAPIRFEQHQKCVLTVAFEPQKYEFFRVNDVMPFQTILYSTVKKSGKTAVSASVARWVAETFGPRQEIYTMANDLEQSRGLIYQKLIDSITLTPGFVSKGVNGTLPGKWRIIDREARYLPNQTAVKAISSDYKGAAGSNPTCTLWTELHGYTSEADRRLWAESTPVPTRPYSFRFIDTYAGYEGESDLLWDLWEKALNSRQLTRDEIPDWPYDGPIPIYVNIPARLCAYIDTGVEARRMPWQKGRAGELYYEAEAHDLTPNEFNRLHLNQWTSSVGQFLPVEWWDALYQPNYIPPLLPGDRTPVIIAADASVTSDATGLVMVSRDPKSPYDQCVERMSAVWYPSAGHPMDYGETIEPTIRDWCNKYNVSQVCYDAYQLHDLMTRLKKEEVVWTEPFSQMADRNKADKRLYDMVRDRRYHHNGNTEVREHIKNCAAKMARDENTKLRIIKKAPASKIDLAVCTSMGIDRCLYLNLV